MIYWALGLGQEHSNSRTNEWCWMGQAQNLTSKIQMGGWFEEECLLGQAKHSSNVYLKVQGNIPTNSSDRGVYLKYTRRLGAQKYLRKSCCHRIECTATTFLTTFMWRKLLNSVVLTTTTHIKPKRVSDGTSTQVKTQMINKCRIKMIQKRAI